MAKRCWWEFQKISPIGSCNKLEKQITMFTIVFHDQKESGKALLAAAYAQSLQTTGTLQEKILCTESMSTNMLIRNLLLEKNISHKVSHSENIMQADLIITFSGDASKINVPSLVPIVKWRMDNFVFKQNGGVIKNEDREIRDRIFLLVDDLFNQGYLMTLSQMSSNIWQIFTNLNLGIITRNADHHISFINKAAEKITGFTHEEILGKKCDTIFSDYENSCSTSHEEQPGAIASVPIKTKTGLTRWLEVIKVPIRMTNEVLIILASFKDAAPPPPLFDYPENSEHIPGIIGQSRKIKEIFSLIRDLAACDIPVSIHGESGTGKELVAHALHNLGSRANGPFIPVNCGAITEQLLESELFGHEKGAFTGAIKTRKGLFERAHCGSIFLDEIGDVSQAMQVKLLRVLENKQIQRVGGEHIIDVDVRIISATNKNLTEEIEKGNFREDLYYRLCVVPITLPALRERRDDIPLLAHFFLDNNPAGSDGKVTLSQEALNALMVYHWPGNIRELQNAIQFARVLCHGETIKLNHLPPVIKGKATSPLIMRMKELQSGKLDRESVLQALQKTNNNRAAAAKLLGVSRATLYRFFTKISLNS